ncbi:MAG: hypothetical protein HQL66_01135 [Magnetococcales bacterium]|nr:hypothetical protein [Magnetococcales bacterium]
MPNLRSGSRVSHRTLISTLVFGAASVALYLALFVFSNDLTEMASLVRQGHKGYVAVPILIALVFSFIHGAFTSHFWDMMGLKARK